MFKAKDRLLALVRGGGDMSGGDKLRLVLMLSVPAMMGQLSSIAMQYIDAMMVGSLGAVATASVGLVSTSTWLFGGVCASLGGGFAVVVAHHIGAREYARARDVMRQAMFVCMMLALCVCLLCVGVHGRLPLWLGGGGEVARLASSYFLVWSLTLPVMQMLFISNAMLRVSGDMVAPFVLGVVMCLLDVLFNSLFIPRWGVPGAAFATTCSGLTAAVLSLWRLLAFSPELSLVHRWGRLRLEAGILRRGFRIALPMAVEHVVFCGAQIASTLIVVTLGTVAVAANTIGIVVESLCYMPGYGIGDAATALIGQSYGARRMDLIRSFSRLTVWLGVAVMTAMGAVMYVRAPWLTRLMNPDALVQAEGVRALRIEAFAEPMYAASIVAYCIFVGLGDTLVPCVMNLGSIWLIRIPLAALLARSMGIQGVWLAMCIELNVRGAIFLARLKLKRIVYNESNS